ncbi:penicillin-binding protein 2 [Candidatus Peregrinibacteria bacterium]|nr:MAG: penicillin-binding protein 2 [Candidatus Peregrinibacteria bacterium]
MKRGFSFATSPAYRLAIVGFFCGLLFLVIVGRLFQLQVLSYDDYSASARDQHFGRVTLPAKRGEILVRDRYSGQLTKLATNTTLDLLYVDPFVVEDKIAVASQLAPLIFTHRDYDLCTENPDDCGYDVIDEAAESPLITTSSAWFVDASEPVSIQSSDVEFKTYAKMIDEVAASVLRKISKQEVDFSILKRDLTDEEMAQVVAARLPGISVDESRFFAYANPTLIPESRLSELATALGAILAIAPGDLQPLLTRRNVRYVFLKNKLEPEISNEIESLNLKGVVLVPEHWRFYPENSIASHLIGFISRDGVGQYGVEGFFDAALRGREGTIYTERDPRGRQITVGNSEIVTPVNGDTIVLTIDRIIQGKVESILAESVERFRADSGQVIILNPFTGAIIAMANYPNFNPNHFSDAFALRPLAPGELVEKTIPVFKKNERGQYVPLEEEDEFKPEIEKFVYQNKFGPEVFKNKIISEFYEPGSIFKPLVMAMALDSKEVEPTTTFLDDGPLHIDEFEIRNSDQQYHGMTTMSDVLAFSLNTGMSFVAKKLGKQLMYRYLHSFGLGEYTNIELEGEIKGRLDFYKQWSKAQLLTTSFGQGIVVTPLQMITAWATLANGGKLVQPYIVDEVIHNGESIKTEPKVITRVISEETASIITAMNINAVTNGVAKPAYVPGFQVAGKTGTAQIAGKYGEYEKETAPRTPLSWDMPLPRILNFLCWFAFIALASVKARGGLPPVRPCLKRLRNF